ncbi:MAG: glycosyltransferase [Piscirickettsiaceae bacterium]|mgnify:CR=1 FL=1|nr:glycosyltransferase [Piscirickettsiaceae bacterium]
MKVIHIITGLATGGAERALYNLLQGGLSTEFDCHVISLSDEGTMGAQIKALGVTVITLNMRAGWPTLAGLLKLRSIIKKLQPDLIQGWMYHGNLAATLARFFMANKPALIWNVRQSLYDLKHEKRLTRLVIKANRFFSANPDVLLYNSQLSRQQHEAFGFSVDKSRVIPNGINLQRFSFSAEARRNILAELSIPKTAVVIGHVARLHPMKDHANFLKAAVILAQRNADIQFILSGRGVSINDEALEKHIPITLQNRFHLLGERNDVADLMSAMDVFCQSSWTEAFPNVLGEAMAVAIPCVATDVGDSALIIGECGVVVPARDADALIAGIEALLILDTIERRVLGQQAHNRIEEQFTLSVIAERYADLYKTASVEKRRT